VNELGLFQLFVLPAGLGLFGFVEPCSIGSSLVFVKYLEGKNRLAKLSQVTVFMLTRGLFIGLLGASAALLGAAFLGFQKAAWIGLGAIYVAIGAVYLLGKAGFLMRTIGPRLSRLPGTRGSATLGILFGLNIPACAAPLIFALFGAAAAGGAAGRPIATGFVSLGLFGLALSLPLVVAAGFAPARRALDWLAGLSRRLPFWTGVVLIALGLWSIGFGFFVNLEDWT
jgi:cytochrome c-type biogenesis protein